MYVVKNENLELLDIHAFSNTYVNGTFTMEAFDHRQVSIFKILYQKLATPSLKSTNFLITMWDYV